jgi:hypothetical protein
MASMVKTSIIKSVKNTTQRKLHREAGEIDLDEFMEK